MPITAIELVKKLMAKAGVTHEGELTGDIPDDIATSLDNNLLTIAAATNNHPDVKKVYFAQAYDGLDSEMKNIITEFGLPDDVKAEIEKVGGSTKRATALIRKIKEISDKAKPEDKTKADALTAQVVELNNKLAAEIQKQTQLKTEYDSQLQQIKVQTKLNGLLSGHKTVFDDLDPTAKQAAIDAIITKNLTDSDSHFILDDKGNLSLMKKDGTNVFGENHTLVTPQSFIDKSLSKILKVTGKPGDNPPAPPLPGGQRNDTNTSLKAALAESLQDYEAAPKNAIAV